LSEGVKATEKSKRKQDELGQEIIQLRMVSQFFLCIIRCQGN